MGDAPITHAVFDEAMDRVITKINDITKKMDVDLGTISLKQGRLSTLISNVQTQLFDKQGWFDSPSLSGYDDKTGPPPPPTHKLRFPKCDGSEDPFDWLHKA